MTDIVQRKWAWTLASLGTVLFMATGAQAGDNWGFHLSPGGVGFSYGSGGHRHHGGGFYFGGPVYTVPPGGYYQPYGYYPRYNPTVRQDYYSSGSYAPDGTFHSEGVTEDRRASYYSPGRNEAVTPPQTTVTEEWGPYGRRTVERTTWIGADGLPHSTTVDRNTTADPWGNTRTDTNVTLKNKTAPSNNPPSGTSNNSGGPTLMPKKTDTSTPGTVDGLNKPPAREPGKSQ